MTTSLLEYADLLGEKSALTSWLAQALQRHQEANQTYLDRKFSELQASWEHVMPTGSVAAQTRSVGRPAKTLAATGALARIAAHEDEFAGGSPATSRVSSLDSSFNSEPKSHFLGATVVTALGERARSSGEDAIDPFTPCSHASKRGLPRLSTKGTVESLKLDGAIDAKADGWVPLPSALVGLRTLLDQFLGSGNSEDQTCQAKTLHWVNAAGIFMVTLNTIFIFLELEKQGSEIAQELGIVPDMTGWDSMEGVFHLADHVFNAFYVAEMIVKLAVMRRDYCKDFMNVLDATIALLNTADLFFLKGNSSSIVLARMARLIKVSKLIRLSRIARASHELCSLINTLYLSLRALAAAAVLLVLIVFITGLGMAHFVSLFLMDECAPGVPLCEWAYRHYGSGSRASWTMFQVTLSGGWPAWAAELVESVNWLFILFWVAYIIVVWFGVLRVITALFLKQTMEVAAADQEMMFKEKLRQKAKHAAAMRQFFAAADVDGDGFVNYAEFKEALLDKGADQWLQRMGIEHTEVDALFQMLDDGDGYISFDELLASAARLGGTARASEQMAILCNQKTMLHRMEQLARGLSIDRSDVTTLRNRTTSAARLVESSQ